MASVTLSQGDQSGEPLNIPLCRRHSDPHRSHRKISDYSQIFACRAPTLQRLDNVDSGAARHGETKDQANWLKREVADLLPNNLLPLINRLGGQSVTLRQYGHVAYLTGNRGCKTVKSDLQLPVLRRYFVP